MKIEKREQILGSALELFAEQGFRGTSTAEIAKHAGVATGTLFHHFKTKEDLINSLYGHIKSKMAKNVLLPLEDDTGLRDKIHDILIGHVSWALNNHREYRFIKYCEASPYIGEQLREECESKFRPLIDLFAQASTDGVIKPLPVELILSLTNGTMDGFISYLTNNPEEVGNKDLWQQAYSAAWDMIR
jgi:AcrR family transcriptional regulator